MLSNEESKFIFYFVMFNIHFVDLVKTACISIYLLKAHILFL